MTMREPVRFVDRLVDHCPRARSEREQAPGQRGGRSLDERLEFHADRGGRCNIECVRCGTAWAREPPRALVAGEPPRGRTPSNMSSVPRRRSPRRRACSVAELNTHLTRRARNRQGFNSSRAAAWPGPCLRFYVDGYGGQDAVCLRDLVVVGMTEHLRTALRRLLPSVWALIASPPNPSHSPPPPSQRRISTCSLTLKARAHSSDNKACPVFLTREP